MSEELLIQNGRVIDPAQKIYRIANVLIRNGKVIGIDQPASKAARIIDATGKLVKAFVDAGETAGFTYEKDIIPFVTKLAG